MKRDSRHRSYTCRSISDARASSSERRKERSRVTDTWPGIPFIWGGARVDAIARRFFLDTRRLHICFVFHEEEEEEDWTQDAADPFARDVASRRKRYCQRRSGRKRSRETRETAERSLRSEECSFTLRRAFETKWNFQAEMNVFVSRRNWTPPVRGLQTNLWEFHGHHLAIRRESSFEISLSATPGWLRFSRRTTAIETCWNLSNERFVNFRVPLSRSSSVKFYDDDTGARRVQLCTRHGHRTMLNLAKFNSKRQNTLELFRSCTRVVRARWFPDIKNCLRVRAYDFIGSVTI